MKLRAPYALGRPLSGFDVLLVLAIIFGLDIVATWMIDALIGEDTPTARNNSDIAWTAFASLNTLAAIWFVILRRRGFTLSDLGYTTIVRRWALIGIALGLALVPVEYALYQEAYRLLDIRHEGGWWQLPGAPHTSGLEGLTVLVYSGIIVPVAEELLFRGVVFRWLRQRFAFWPSAVASAALFGWVHVWLDAMVAAGVMGIILAWLYERSRSLAPAILTHQAFNLAVVTLALAAEWTDVPGL